MNTPSAVPFPGSSRIHVALGATDLERSARFYEVLLGAPPTKRRPGYVKFEPSDPSVNLTLNQVGPREPAPRGVSHFGVQVSSTDDVRDTVQRLSEAGRDGRGRGGPPAATRCRTRSGSRTRTGTAGRCSS